MQLCVLGPDGSLTSVYGDTTSRRLHIHNGLLLPPISINPDWFTADSKGMATLVLLDAEPDPGANPAAAGPSNAASQVWQWEALPQQELGRFYLRLAPAAERLLVMAAGQLFQGAVVELPPQQQSGARGKSQRAATLFCLQEVRQARILQSSQTWRHVCVQYCWHTMIRTRHLLTCKTAPDIFGLRHFCRCSCMCCCCCCCFYAGRSKCAAPLQPAAAGRQPPPPLPRVRGQRGVVCLPRTGLGLMLLTPPSATLTRVTFS